MIAELIEWARLSCAPELARYGYRREAAALRVRHRRSAADWAPHLHATRTALLAAAQHALHTPQPPRSAWLLGAGQLQDVPLQALLDRFEQVVLADLVFGPEARHAARRTPALKLLPLDVTGVLAFLHPRPPLPDPYASPPRFPDDAWVASINLLSQLPLLPCAWLLRHGGEAAQLEQWGQSIMRAHIAALETATHACLIAEIADLHEDGEEEAALPESVLRALSRPGWRAESCWKWQLHPHTRKRPEHAPARRVQAWRYARPTDTA